MIKKMSLLLLVFALACSNKSLPGTKNQQDQYKKIATEKLGEDVKFIPNDLKSYLLCVHDEKKTFKNPDNNLKLLVYDLSGDKIALELNVGPGTVKWIGSYEIEVYFKPGVMRRDETRDNYTTIYNLNTGEKRKKSN